MILMMMGEYICTKDQSGLRVLSAQELIDHAAEINLLKLQAADIEKMDRQVKIWLKALVKLHNEKCPEGERFSMDELKAKVEELAR